jgi:chitosanase
MNVLMIMLFSFSVFATASRIETVVDQVVSAFENSSTEVQYKYIENIHDGRGYTAGKAGFTTGTGDLYDLVQSFSKKKASSLFIPLLPVLKKRSEDASSSVRGLEDLISIWKKSCRDPDFITEQDLAVERMYKRPARAHLKDFGFSYPLTYLVIYDAVIQHGNGDDADSFSGIVKLMKSHPADEKEFVNAFLESRIEVLKNPDDDSTASEWKKSVDRVYALQKIVESGNWQLTTPFKLIVWGEHFTVK